MELKEYKVTMWEKQPDGRIEKLVQTAICENEEQIIDWYGLKNRDIEKYEIHQIL